MSVSILLQLEVGSSYKLKGTVYNENGIIVNADALPEIYIKQGGEEISGPFTTTQDGTGVYYYWWSVPDDMTLGAYIIEWRATIGGNPHKERNIHDIVETGVS